MVHLSERRKIQLRQGMVNHGCIKRCSPVESISSASRLSAKSKKKFNCARLPLFSMIPISILLNWQSSPFLEDHGQLGQPSDNRSETIRWGLKMHKPGLMWSSKSQVWIISCEHLQNESSLLCLQIYELVEVVWPHRVKKLYLVE